MAELLIKLEDTDNPKDLNAWDKGHVVCVQKDGWEWGKCECPPKFAVVKVPDMSAEEAQKYMEPEMSKLVDINNILIQLTIRKVKIDIESTSLSSKVKSDLKSMKAVSLTKAQVVSCEKVKLKDGK